MTPEKPCGDPARDLLDDFADGSLSPERAEGVAAHLESCETCRNDLDGLVRFERAARGSHLTTTEIVDAAWGRGDVDTSHVSDCPACREELAAVRAAIPPGIPRALERAPSKAPRPWPRSWVAMGLAASLLAGVGLVVISRGERTVVAPSSARGPGDQVPGLVPAGDLARGLGELGFSWTGKPSARYAVLFFTSDGRVIDRVSVLGTRFVADPPLRGKLEHESEFFWKVDPIEGDDASGSRLTRVAWRP